MQNRETSRTDRTMRQTGHAEQGDKQDRQNYETSRACRTMRQAGHAEL